MSFEADYEEPRSRLTTFFRGIMVIPHLIVLFIWGIAAAFAILFAWFAIVFTTQYPEGLYNFVAGFTRYVTRVTAYLFLMTDNYPAFSGADDAAYPIRMQFAGPLPAYSRAKTGFRFILGIPIVILRYGIGILLEIGAIGAWFVIVITGKQPRGLHDLLELGMTFTARSDAYLWLLTETYPPFQVDRAQVEAPPAPPAMPAPEAPTSAPAESPEPRPPQA